MSFGIGLGAFVEGFGRGMDMRDRIDQRNKQRKIDKGLADIEKDTAAKFADPLSDDAYEYTLKRQELLYRQNGELDKALAFRKFGETDAARRGTKLFASSLFKAQTGDAAGALDDAIKAGKINGYLDHGYEVLGQDEIRDKDGKTVGFRLKVKGPDGKEIDQDVAVGDIPRMVATFANPQAAFESQQKAAEDSKKRTNELEDYETKKKIDRQYKDPGDDAADYRKVAEDLSKSDIDWGDRSAEEQDRMIRDRLSAAKKYATDANGTPAPAGALPGGAPASAPQKVIVDQGSGEVVDPAAGPIGLGSPSPSPAPAPAAARQPVGTYGIGGAAAAAPPTDTPAPEAPKGPSKQQMIDDAANYAASGGNPEAIAQRLMSAGIAEQEWPQTVRSALAKRQSGQAPGLGM